MIRDIVHLGKEPVIQVIGIMFAVPPNGGRPACAFPASAAVKPELRYGGPMKDRGDHRGMVSQDSFDEAEFGMERIMAYTVSAIGLCLIILKIMSSP
jgi:hypothetical protein